MKNILFFLIYIMLGLLSIGAAMRSSSYQYIIFMFLFCVFSSLSAINILKETHADVAGAYNKEISYIEKTAKTAGLFLVIVLILMFS